MRLNQTPMVTKLSPRPEHTSTCPISQLSFDSWHKISQYFEAADFRNFQRVCSCGYGLVRQLEVQTRRSLSLRTEDFIPNHEIFPVGHYSFLQRYLLRYNLSNLQCLKLQMKAFKTIPLPRHFFNFLARHCPLLSELCLSNVTFLTSRQDMICSFEHLTRLEVSCVFLRGMGYVEWFPSEDLAAVVKSSKKLKHLHLNQLRFRRSFFDSLPDGVESLVLDGLFCGIPADVLLSRFNETLNRLCMSVSLRRIGTGADDSTPVVSLLQLAALHSLKLHHSPIHLPVERHPWSSLQHLELHKPLDFSQDTVDALGVCCPKLRFLLLRRRYLDAEPSHRNSLDLRPLAALEELRMPQDIDFEIFTNRLPTSLRVLQIRMQCHMIIGCPDTDVQRLPVHQYFDFLLTLPHLEYLECGPVFYPNRSFLIEILNQRRRFPFLTIAQKTIGIPGEDQERRGQSFRFLPTTNDQRPEKSILKGLRLQRDG